MSRFARGVLTASVSLTLLGAGLASPAHAADITIREDDFIAPSSTNAGGEVDFLREGLLIRTNSSSGKAAEYWERSGSIPTSGSYVWQGTSNQPSAQFMFDVDGDSATTENNFNVLVGEQAYSDGARGENLTEWWYTGGQARAALRGFTCPDTSGGSGSDCHGTLDEWAAELPDAEVYRAGFSLGSGPQGEGHLRSISLGDDTYTFTSDEEATAPVVAQSDVTGSSTVARSNQPFRVVVTMRSDAQPANTTTGRKLNWRVAVDGTTQGRFVQSAGETDSVRATFRPNSGKHKVRVFKNGALVRDITVNTRKRR